MASSPFHDGERAVQRLAGVTALADRVGGSIRRDLPAAARTFLGERRWVVIGALDREARPWPAIRAGLPGFAHAAGDRSVRIEAIAPAGDPLSGLLDRGALVALLAIDPATRRRLRVNGRVTSVDRGGFVLDADQVFSNCPKYIQRRDEQAAAVTTEPGVTSTATVLTGAQRDRLRAADTFFIASGRPGDGVDVSHRGGMPGFVRVDGQRIAWPDYGGNAMFNTLGNLHVHPSAGLLVPDFETGGALIVTGRARVDWDPEHAAAIAGAERVVTLDVDRVVEQAGVLPLAFQLREYSPFNPR